VSDRVKVAVVIAAWAVGVVVMGAAELLLPLAGLPAISDLVWNGHWLLGVVVVAWLLALPAFLVGHFWFGWFRDR
jgi:hypothetical protein